MNLNNLIYALTCLSFSVIIGAAIYEHTALWPNAYAALPKSLSVFQGPYKLNSEAFWIPVHPVTLALFTITLLLNWKTARKKYVLFPMMGYIAVLIVTFSVFVPQLIELTRTPYSDTVDPYLTSRGSRWVTMSLIRATILFILAIGLFLGLTKPDRANSKV